MSTTILGNGMLSSQTDCVQKVRKSMQTYRIEEKESLWMLAQLQINMRKASPQLILNY